jgi:hypothetical protein
LPTTYGGCPNSLLLAGSGTSSSFRRDAVGETMMMMKALRKMKSCPGLSLEDMLVPAPGPTRCLSA